MRSARGAATRRIPRADGFLIGRRRRFGPWLAVAAAGGATVLAYPPFAVPGIGLVMLAPLAYALDGLGARRGFLATWLYTLGSALAIVHWLVYALVVEYRVPALPAGAFAVVVVGGIALATAVAGAGFAALAPKLTDLWAPLAFASLWMLGEWLRGAWLGVPWLLVAHTLARLPLAIQSADLGGSYAVGLAPAALGAGLGLALRRRSLRPLAIPAGLAAAAVGYGAWRLAGQAPGAPTFRVGVVQASVPQEERFQPGSAARNVARHTAATRALAARERLDLLVWSETAVDIDLDSTPSLRAALEQLATETGVPLVTGAPRSEGGRHTNSVVLFAPGRGLVESYAKQVLVPWSEYDPKLGGVLAALIGPVTEGEPYRAGELATVLRGGPLPLSTPVCFEVTYPNLVRRFRANGAVLFVNLSNDAWFGPVGYPQMHLAHAIFRAVEERSWVVRGANTGISAAIDPAGRVVAEVPAFQSGTFTADVWAAGAPPFYARNGDAPAIAALAALAALSAVGSRGGGRAGATAARRKRDDSRTVERRGRVGAAARGGEG